MIIADITKAHFFLKFKKKSHILRLRIITDEVLLKYIKNEKKKPIKVENFTIEIDETLMGKNENLKKAFSLIRQKLLQVFLSCIYFL